MRRWLYYLGSIPTLLMGIREWWLVLSLFLGLPLRRPLAISLRRSGLRFLVRSAMDVWIIKETCLDSDYERFGAPVQKGWTVVDIGAGLGDFSLLASRRVGTGGRVLAYEPFPESFALLERNVQLNKAANITLYPRAVASQPGTLRLEQRTDAVRNATAVDAGSIAVQAVSLQETLGGLERCDLMKVDCEGGEYDIFLGAEESALAKIRLICMEYHDGVTPHSHADLVRRFARAGFRVTVYPSRVQGNLGFLTAQRLNAEV